MFAAAARLGQPAILLTRRMSSLIPLASFVDCWMGYSHLTHGVMGVRDPDRAAVAFP